MLLGLGAAIFIALAHRLFRQPAPKIKLASIRLLPLAKEEPVRARRWQDLPLMALRLLLWVLLALTLARPSCPVQQDIEVYQSPQAAFIVLQADARSHHIVAQQSLWQHSLARAQTLIDALPPGSFIYLAALTANLEHRFVGTDKEGAQATLRAWGKLAEPDALVRQSQTSLSHFFPALAQAARQAPLDLPRIGYYIGEPQPQCPSQGSATMSEWICLNALDKLEPRAPSTQLAITDLEVITKAGQGEPTLEFVAKIHNFGTRKQLDQPLDIEWYVDGQLRQTQRAPLIAGNAQVSWFYGTKDDKAHRVRVQLRQKDPFILDNRQARWVAKTPVLRVLLVDGDPSEQREHDEIYLLAKALEQAFPKPGIMVRGTDPAQFEALLKASPDKRPDYDVVVLANASALPAKQSQVLEHWVKQGLGLWITAGSRINAKDYNQSFDALLPLRLRSASATAQGALELSAPDSSHPIFTAHMDPMPLKGGGTRRVFLLEPDPRREAAVALRFANGAPALVTKKLEKGRVAWWSTSIDLAWTKTVLDPGFVPLSRAIIRWLSKAEEIQSSSQQGYVGQPLKFSSSQRIKVQGPKQVKWVPAGSEFFPERIGLYQGSSPGAKQSQHFAALLDPSASPPPVGAPPAKQERPSAKKAGVRSYLPIWPYLWPLAALALVLETLLRMLRLSR